MLPSTSVKAIFWGSSWPSSAGDKITGLDKWYTGVRGTSYAATVDEYMDAAGKSVSSSISYSGPIVDSSAVPRTLGTSAVLVRRGLRSCDQAGCQCLLPRVRGQEARLCKLLRVSQPGNLQGNSVEFGFFFDLDGDGGCDPQSTVSGQSQGLAALANVTGHELSETRSDPNDNAWFDSSGEENGDKCRWTFGGSYVLLGSTKWKIQGHRSNYDYDHNIGYANSSGEEGCADGANYPGPYKK
jgi:hypothetical protein